VTVILASDWLSEVWIYYRKAQGILRAFIMLINVEQSHPILKCEEFQGGILECDFTHFLGSLKIPAFGIVD